MKIIRSFLLVAVCLFATNLLRGQELKATVAPRTAESKILKADDRPSVAPTLIPQPASTTPVTSTATDKSAPKKGDVSKPTDNTKPKSATLMPAAAATDVQQTPAAQTQMQPAFLREQKKQ